MQLFFTDSQDLNWSSIMLKIIERLLGT